MGGRRRRSWRGNMCLVSTNRVAKVVCAALAVVAPMTLTARVASGAALGRGQTQMLPASALPCGGSVALVAAPSRREYTVIGGQMAVARLATGASPNASTGGFFAKRGLLVKQGASFEIVSSNTRRVDVSMSWGGAPRTNNLKVSSCGEAGARRWMAFPGGFYVDRRACVTVLVKIDADTSRLRVAAGATCP